MTIVRSQLLLAITAGFGLTFAFCACGDNSHPPKVDSMTYGDFDQFPDLAPPDPAPECALPPADEAEEDCFFVCQRKQDCDVYFWECTEVCDCRD